MMKTILCILSALSITASAQPNFIMVLIDDMGWGDFSCFGNKDAQTPNIDRMAAEGIRFEQFHVNSPICSPSRCALTTGQYPDGKRLLATKLGHFSCHNAGRASSSRGNTSVLRSVSLERSNSGRKIRTGVSGAKHGASRPGSAPKAALEAWIIRIIAPGGST
jgi:uncharacterized sulfatase